MHGALGQRSYIWNDIRATETQSLNLPQRLRKVSARGRSLSMFSSWNKRGCKWGTVASTKTTATVPTFCRAPAGRQAVASAGAHFLIVRMSHCSWMTIHGERMWRASSGPVAWGEVGHRKLAVRRVREAQLDRFLARAALRIILTILQPMRHMESLNQEIALVRHFSIKKIFNEEIFRIKH